VREHDKRFARGVAVAAVAVFAVAACCAWREVRYAVAARTATATVDGVMEHNAGSRRMGRRPVVLVKYHFTDAGGTARTGAFDIGPLAPRPRRGSTVQVEYVGGSSRAPGGVNGGALFIFFSGLVALAVGAVFYGHKACYAAERE